MFAITGGSTSVTAAEGGEDWSGTVDDEAEEARGKGGETSEKTARSFRQETTWIWGACPWALNQNWKVSSGQAEQSGAGKEGYLKKVAGFFGIDTAMTTIRFSIKFLIMPI
jgi:hypothetical protein